MPRGALATPFAAVVMDARTGQILHATNHDTRLHPASLTKMMTLYVAFEAIRNGEITLDTRIRISRRAASEVPSRLGLREGQQIALRYLIRGAALRSGNDAATAIAEGISGSVENFAARMNRTAAAIGMNNTTFRNAHGLTQAGHMSTARDMTLLGRQLYFDYPQYYNLFSRRTEHAGVAQVRNTNWRLLDGYRGADGIKTGYTRAAGYNLTASAERNGVRIIVTVFGGRSVQHRHEQIVALMNRGFREAPARAAVRRPSRPDYSRPPAQVAQAPSRQAAPQSGAQGRAAGRVIRLQTAPTRSLFPQPRPLPEALLAAVQSGAATARTELAVPDDDEDPDLPDELAAEARAAGSLPSRSPLPPARPAAIVALAAASTAPGAADGAIAEAQAIAAAEEAGFTVIDAEELAARTGAATDPEAASDPVQAVAMAELPAETGSAEPDTTEPETAMAASAPELGALAQQPPAERPADLVPGSDQVAASSETPPEEIGAPEPDTAEAAVAEAGTPDLALPDSAELLAGVRIESGQIVIPGLPPIPAPGQPEAVATMNAAPPDAPHTGEGSTSDTDAIAAAASTPAERGGRITVTPEGQILWRDDDLLRGLDDLVARIESGEVPAGATSGIVLTSADAGPPAIAPPSPPEITIRVSSSGNQAWAVDLGRFGSRFDAERTLLRVALAESGTLGGGVRRVVESGSGFRGMVVSLTQDQAERACLRLATASQSCSVVTP